MGRRFTIKPLFCDITRSGLFCDIKTIDFVISNIDFEISKCLRDFMISQMIFDISKSKILADFVIKNRFCDIKIRICDITKSRLFFTKKSIMWYRKFWLILWYHKIVFATSKNWICDISQNQGDFYITDLIFSYHKIDFVISQNILWYHKLFLISQNRMWCQNSIFFVISQSRGL